MRSRSHIRHNSDIPITFETDIMMGHHTSCVQDIGQGGLSFIAHGPLASGTQLKICFPYPISSFSVNGTISWCHGDKNGAYHLGVKFENLLCNSILKNIALIEQMKQLNIKNTGRAITAEDAILKMSNKAFDYDLFQNHPHSLTSQDLKLCS